MKCWIAALLLVGTLSGQVVPAFSCAPNPGTPPAVNQEGLTELGGDVVLNCTGGPPTPAGQTVPTFNVQIFLNTNITSRLLKDTYTEALLTIDQPARSNQVINAGADITSLRGVGGSGINYSNPAASANGGQDIRNVFQGKLVDQNSLMFSSVPIDPAATGPRVIRITNIRVNANALGVSSTNVPTPIVAYVSINGATAVPITNPSQTLAVVQRGLVEFALRDAVSNKECVDLNRMIVDQPAAFPSNARIGAIRFREGAANAFRRSDGTSNSAFPNSHPTGGDLTKAGLADIGTRLRAVFRDIPKGVQLYVGTSEAICGTTPGVDVRLVDPPAPSSGQVVSVPIVNGTASPVWEITSSGNSVAEAVEITYLFAYRATGVPGDIGTGTAMAAGGFAPAPASILPNFFVPANPTNAHAALTTSNCANGNPAIDLTRQQLPLNFSFTTGGPPPDTITQILQTPNIPVTQLLADAVVNAGPGIEHANLATTDWLTVGLNQAGTPATASVSVNPVGLAVGTYTGIARFTAPAAQNSPITFPVRLTVSAPGPLFTILGAGNAASYFPFQVAPGEAMVIFGSRFGPAALATLVLGADGKASTLIGETRVLFDGVPAPMIYAINGQVSCFAPFSIAGKTSTKVQVEYRGVLTPEVAIAVAPAVPGLFTINQSGTGQGAILNQNGSVNGATARAGAEEIIVLFGTGAGQTNPGGVDGQIAGAPVPAFLLPVKVVIDGQQAEVLYSGQAPGLIEGVLQVNARLPRGTRSGNVPVTVVVGDRPSQAGVTVAVR